MSKRPYIIGLTGSIGMGKSAVAAMFRAQGVPVFDADAAVRSLQGSGGALLPQIEAYFPGTTGAAGVDRAKLGAAVFGHPEALKQLERLIHPAVGRMRTAFRRRNRSRKLLVFDIPLLFETDGDRKVDYIVVVSAAPWQQRRRVLARPGMNTAKLRQIRKIQTPDAVKRRRADTIIPTGGLKSVTQAKLRLLLRKLRSTLA